MFYIFVYSKPWQDKAKSMLQSYLDSVLVDDRLNQSEIIYSFLSPSPDYLKTASSLPPSITRLKKLQIVSQI
jgi:sorting nexin-25